MKLQTEVGCDSTCRYRGLVHAISEKAEVPHSSRSEPSFSVLLMKSDAGRTCPGYLRNMHA